MRKSRTQGKISCPSINSFGLADSHARYIQFISAGGLASLVHHFNPSGGMPGYRYQPFAFCCENGKKIRSSGLPGHLKMESKDESDQS